MARMIERWFPCDDVTERSQKGWGGGKSENGLFPWYASRPPAQAKAAVICSLLEWPDGDPADQARLKALVKETMTGYDAAQAEITAELRHHHPDGATMIDPFSGRAIIPAEAARLGVKAYGVDYSPVAAFAGRLLADWPLRDWSAEPELPFATDTGNLSRPAQARLAGSTRLLSDVAAVLEWVGERHRDRMAEFYPRPGGRTPWAYLWAVTVPCVACGGRFPLTADLRLRNPNRRKNDPGQSYRLIPDASDKTIAAEVLEGRPTSVPTMVKRPGQGQGRGKGAICPFCAHYHTFNEHTRLRTDGKAGDMLLVVAEVRPRGTPKHYRTPAAAEVAAAERALRALADEGEFAPGLPAVPHESCRKTYPGGRSIRKYGYRAFGDYCHPRQTLSFVRLARCVNNLFTRLAGCGISRQYGQALCGYASSVLARMLLRATRGASLLLRQQAIRHIAAQGSVVPMGNDYMEAGPYEGPGTWRSVSQSTLSTLRRTLTRQAGPAAEIARGPAQHLPHRSDGMTAVVTDPPYDSMVDYCDASDLAYVWLKRAMSAAQPGLAVTSDPASVQEKTHEATVAMSYDKRGDHRTPEHYDGAITQAFAEARRVTADDGVVTIIFGHDDPDVWKRLLRAIGKAGLVLTGSWPARTETGSQLNKANIEVTLTLVCRPAPQDRPVGRLPRVREEIRAEIASRGGHWDDAGLEALRDRRIAAYGPAMEAAGRYAEVRDNRGRPVDTVEFLAFARRVVTESAGLKIGNMPADAFDVRTRFALAWTAQHARLKVSGSEARWERLTHDVTEADVSGLLKRMGNKTRLILASETPFGRAKRAGASRTGVRRAGRTAPAAAGRTGSPGALSAAGLADSVIDLALGVAACGKSVTGISAFLAEAAAAEDQMLWAAIGQLAADLPDADTDGDTWTWAVRNRGAIESGTEQVVVQREVRRRDRAARKAQTALPLSQPR